MKITTKIKPRSARVACLLPSAIAMPAWSDTLILRNGAIFSGTLTGANSNSIMFRDRRGDLRRYSVRDVEAVQFGDAPYRPHGGPGEYGQSSDDRRDDLGNGNDQSYGNQDNPGYDPDRRDR